MNKSIDRDRHKIHGGRSQLQKRKVGFGSLDHIVFFSVITPGAQKKKKNSGSKALDT